MFYFALRTFRFLITFSINIKQQFQKNENKQFYSYSLSLSFSVLSLLFASSQLFRNGPTLLSLLLSFPCFFVHYSVIYHCFPPATEIGPFPFFVPLFVPLQSFHPVSTLSLDFHFPSPLSSSQFLVPFLLFFRCSPLPKVYDPPCFLSLGLRHVFLLSSPLCCILSLFSTIYCLYELFFPCILLLLLFL
jgi:hypothetical protein